MTDSEYRPPEPQKSTKLPEWAIIVIILNIITILAVLVAIGYLSGTFQLPPSGDYEQLLGATLRKQADGIIFDQVYESQAVQLAGIRQGDELLAINGERFDRPQEAMRLVESFEQGDQIRVVVRLAPQQVQQYVVVLGETNFIDPPVVPTLEPIPTRVVIFPTEPAGEASLGINYQMVGPDDPFGVTGALVISTQPGGPAAQTGIEAGDIILSINNQQLDNFTTLQDALRDYRSNQVVTIRIQRDGREEVVRVRLG